MVILDATVLLMFFYDDADPPNDPNTNLPLERCADRIQLLIESLSAAGTQVIIPTPVLAELLVGAGDDLQDIQARISSEHAFQIQPFDQMAAVEMAAMLQPQLDERARAENRETKVKLKFDLQILAIAKIHGVTTIYTDDAGLRTKAIAQRIRVVGTHELALPPEPPQGVLDLEPPERDDE